MIPSSIARTCPDSVTVDQIERISFDIKIDRYRIRFQVDVIKHLTLPVLIKSEYRILSSGLLILRRDPE